MVKHEMDDEGLSCSANSYLDSDDSQIVEDIKKRKNQIEFGKIMKE